MQGLYPIIRRVRRPLIAQAEEAGQRVQAPPETVPLVEEQEAVTAAKPQPKREKKANGRENKQRT
jgi:hypothetical protein